MGNGKEEKDDVKREGRKKRRRGRQMGGK